MVQHNLTAHGFIMTEMNFKNAMPAKVQVEKFFRRN